MNLIVVLGNLRGGIASFESTIKACEGDYALLVSKQTPNYWHAHAKFDWSFDEPSNWDNQLNYYGNSWRCLSAIPEQWLGPAGGQGGSAGILIYCRRMLWDKIQDLNYDNLVIIRSDCLWADKLPEIDKEIMIPDGEGYDGLTDRLHIIPWSKLDSYFNQIRRIWDDSNNLLEELRFQNISFNLEKFFACYLCKYKLFHHRTVCIREPHDGSRWSYGVWNERLKKIIKYQSEYDSVCRNYGKDWKPL